jgi:hypothetical protein
LLKAVTWLELVRRYLAKDLQVSTQLK